LFDEPQTARHEALGRALDAINAKHGKGAIGRGGVDERDHDTLDRGVEHRDVSGD
jgi:hypothetical protein